MRRRNITGMKSNKLIAIKDVGSKRGERLWECKCDCGKKLIVPASYIVSNRIKSCGCMLNLHTLSKGKAAFNYLYLNYKHNAKKKNHKFELSKDEFKKITSQHCYYCGIAPHTKSRGSGGSANGVYLYNGIDRVNNIKGYIKENCVPCCNFCNHAKKDMSAKEFLVRISQIYKHSINETLK